LKERVHLQDPGLDRRIILIWFFRKWDVVTWTGSRRGGYSVMVAKPEGKSPLARPGLR
jgi:hypothetical protein